MDTTGNRFSRIGKWVGLLACIMVGGLWMFASCSYLQLHHPIRPCELVLPYPHTQYEGYQITFFEGCVIYEYPEYFPEDRRTFGLLPMPFQPFGPPSVSFGFQTRIVLPLWMVFAGVAAFTVHLWRRDLRWRSRMDNRSAPVRGPGK